MGKQTITQNTDLQKQIVEIQSRADQYRMEKQDLNEKLLALENKLNYQQSNFVDKSQVGKMEMKLRELETKLDFEKSTSKRLENSLTRTKEQLEKYSGERNLAEDSKLRSKDEQGKLQKQLRSLQDEIRDVERQKIDLTNKAIKAEAEAEELRASGAQSQADLKIALKRIADLQTAFEDLENSDIDSDDLELSGESEDDGRLTVNSKLTKLSKKKRAEAIIKGTLNELDDSKSCIPTFTAKTK